MYGPKRYEQINDFEKMLTQNQRQNPEILPAHQQRRAEETIPGTNRRSGQALENLRGRISTNENSGTTTPSAYEEPCADAAPTEAPWFMIPSNKKWFRNLAVSHIIVETLESMKMKFPPPTVDVKKLKWK